MLWDGFSRSLRSSGELWRPKLSSGGPGESSEARSSIHSSNLRGGAEAQELRGQGCLSLSRWSGAPHHLARPKELRLLPRILGHQRLVRTEEQ